MRRLLFNYDTPTHDASFSPFCRYGYGQTPVACTNPPGCEPFHEPFLGICNGEGQVLAARWYDDNNIGKRCIARCACRTPLACCELQGNYCEYTDNSGYCRAGGPRGFMWRMHLVAMSHRRKERAPRYAPPLVPRPPRGQHSCRRQPQRQPQRRPLPPPRRPLRRQPRPCHLLTPRPWHLRRHLRWHRRNHMCTRRAPRGVAKRPLSSCCTYASKPLHFSA